MSVQAMGAVIERSANKGTDLLVLILIANYINKGVNHAFPSIETLACDARMTRRQIQRIIKRLVGSGELRITPGSGPAGTHVYALVLPEGPPDVLSGPAVNSDPEGGRKDYAGGGVNLSRGGGDILGLFGHLSPPNTPSLLKATKNNSASENTMRALIEFFITQCQALKNFKPEIARGKDAKALAGFLKHHDDRQARHLMTWFLESKKAQDLGVSLGICFSAHTVNLWKAEGSDPGPLVPLPLATEA